jgi:hypothetical protein
MSRQFRVTLLKEGEIPFSSKFHLRRVDVMEKIDSQAMEYASPASRLLSGRAFLPKPQSLLPC